MNIILFIGKVIVLTAVIALIFVAALGWCYVCWLLAPEPFSGIIFISSIIAFVFVAAYTLLS